MSLRTTCLLLSIVFSVSLSCHRPAGGGEQKAPPLTADFLRKPVNPKGPTYDGKWLIRASKIWTLEGEVLDDGHIAIADGKIKAVGKGPGELEQGATLVDASGMFVTPGLIDTHSHMGVYPLPRGGAHQDGNEATRASSPDVGAEDSFWPKDPSLWRAVAGGITTIQVLPGSANLIGGRTFTAKLHPAESPVDMRFPGAPGGIKMACGENPKRVYGDKGGPSTRMGNLAGFRKSFQQALEYRRTWQRYDRDLTFYNEKLAKAGDDQAKRRALGDPPQRPVHDQGLETLREVLDGQRLVHNHCYRADDMSLMLDLAQEFGFKIRSFHHALEAYKIAPRLAAEEVSVSTWADWWGFKLEAYDGIPHGAAMVHHAKGRAIIHSDSEVDIRFLNQEAAKAQTSGRELGLDISDEDALSWITTNPAWALGIQEKTGSLKVGKMADIVIWSHHPLSPHALVERVFIDGEARFNRATRQVELADLELGQRSNKLHDGRDVAKPAMGLDAYPAGPAQPKQVLAGGGSFYLKNVMVDSGDGTPQKGPTGVLVDKGLIVKIGPAPDPLTVPVVDGEGGVVTPGLIHGASQLGLVEVPMEKATSDRGAKDDLLVPGLKAVTAFNPQTVRIGIARKDGLTTSVVLPGGAFVSGQGFLVRLDGSLQPVESRAFVQKLKLQGGSHSRNEFWLYLEKLMADTLTLEGQKPHNLHPRQYHPVHLKGWLDVLKGRLPLMVETHRAGDILELLAWQARLKKEGHKVRLMIIGGREAPEVADQLAAAKVPVMVTPSMQAPFDFDSLKSRDDVAAYLLSKDVPVILVSQNPTRLRQEAGHAMRYGLPRPLALMMITGGPAKVFGLKDRGVLSPGKRADLVLWSGDPLDPRTHALKLWVNGLAQSLETRQSLLGKRYLAR